MYDKYCVVDVAYTVLHTRRPAPYQTLCRARGHSGCAASCGTLPIHADLSVPLDECVHIRDLSLPRVQLEKTTIRPRRRSEKRAKAPRTCMRFMRVANCRVLGVSLMAFVSWLTVRTTEMRAFPERDGWRGG